MAPDLVVPTVAAATTTRETLQQMAATGGRAAVRAWALATCQHAVPGSLNIELATEPATELREYLPRDAVNGQAWRLTAGLPAAMASDTFATDDQGIIGYSTPCRADLAISGFQGRGWLKSWEFCDTEQTQPKGLAGFSRKPF